MLQPARSAAGFDQAGQLCSICQTTLIAGEVVLACPSCGLPFHAECWDENRGCSAYGCQCAPKTVKSDAPDAAALSNAWGGEKPCPNCGKTIKANALKCRFCGSAFETRDVIARDEFARREYEGTEYNAARNKAVILFLLSAAACLAPIGLILNLVLIYNGQLWGMEFKRMPAALKAVIYCAAAVSVLLLVVLALAIVLDSK
jgi:predicted RNA-binding Zn-ribbon protein involved in translation (DUF1610 family)